MPSSAGPHITTDGLILSLDAGDRKNSFLPFSTFLNMTTWGLGSGGATGYGQNGNTNENERVNGTDPWGNSAIVWESRPSGDGNADGGWNTDWYNIDNTKLYRFSVWVKRTSSSSGGYSYLGLYGTGGTWGVERLDNGANEGNPYWECNGPGAYTQNQWYLLVGHCYPAGTTGISGNKHPDTGRYTINGKDGDLNYCNVGGDVRWLSNSTQTLHRTYHYYCGDNTTRLQWFDPRIDLCDGTEPSIRDLLTAAPNNWRSTVKGPKVGTLINGTSYTKDNVGTLSFDGTDDYVNISSNSDFALGTGNFTLEVMIYPQSFSSYTHMVALPLQNIFALKANVSDGVIYYYDPSFTTYGSTSGWTLTLNQWNHVVLVRQANIAYAYLNGTSKGSVSGFNTNMGTQAMNIGWGWGSEFTSKKISTVRMYNRALSSIEIQNSYNQLKSRFNLP